jgi:hypothetical protein
MEVVLIEVDEGSDQQHRRRFLERTLASRDPVSRELGAAGFPPRRGPIVVSVTRARR